MWDQDKWDREHGDVAQLLRHIAKLEQCVARVRGLLVPVLSRGPGGDPRVNEGRMITVGELRAALDSVELEP